MLAELKRVLNGVNAEKSSQVVWEVSTIEYTGGKRNTDNVLFDTFCSSNNFYNKIVSYFENANNVEVLKNKCREENNEVVFKNIVYKVLNSEKYKTFGVCLKRKNIYKTIQIFGSNI